MNVFYDILYGSDNGYTDTETDRYVKYEIIGLY